MKKTITTCDVCNKEAEVVSVNYPVVFHTEQNEGRACESYISQQKLDICEEYQQKLLMLDGWGAQGYNSYKIKEGK
ncbi:hypothetical protein V6C42_12920 [Pseudoclostridium thermosuccinogenes]|uniref:hypothetical protein n=1 Tax=Clostridium thermosuccinogenes TaxID=84032 RepID=UPI002FD9CB4D